MLFVFFNVVKLFTIDAKENMNLVKFTLEMKKFIRVRENGQRKPICQYNEGATEIISGCNQYSRSNMFEFMPSSFC